MKNKDERSLKKDNSSLNPSKNFGNDSFSKEKNNEISKEVKNEPKDDSNIIFSNGSGNFTECSHDEYHGSPTQEMTTKHEEINGNNFSVSELAFNGNMDDERDEDEKINNFDINNYSKNF